MKKFFLLCSIFLLFFFTGCNKSNQESILDSLDKKINDAKSYRYTGDLSIINNEDVYNYTVSVLFKAKDNYRVNLVNKANNHEQIILRNSDGVYVLTPALNKSFKFQSDWPNHSSESYLLLPVLNDIKNDTNKTFQEENDTYIFTTTANYPNNSKLVKQEVVVDKDGNITAVRVLDENNIKQIEMLFNKIEYNVDIADSEFDISQIVVPTEEQTTNEMASLDEAIFPLYLPSGTKLVDQQTIATDAGDRVILTFDGESSFVLVEETAMSNEELEVIPTSGEPYLLMGTYGSLNDNSITWTSGGIDYYITSDVMSQQELIEVARSLSVIPTMK